MTEDQVRALLFKRAERYVGSRRGSTGVSAWAVAHGIPKGHVSEFINGKRGPVAAILDALKLEWRIVRKASPSLHGDGK